MRYFAPLDVVIQQGDIFSQNAEVVKFLSSSPGRTGLEEEVQVLFTPTEKIKKQEQKYSFKKNLVIHSMKIFIF